MNKAFTKETDGDDESAEDELDALEADAAEALALPAGTKNYMTPAGHAALQKELETLVKVERPKVVEVVSWAAGNGDRSENGDYIYGKKRLREIDRRLRFLSKRLDNAEVVDPDKQKNLTRVFFGATVSYQTSEGIQHRVKLVGIDEAEVSQGKISWQSPVARSLMKAEVGDTVTVITPNGRDSLEILAISYG
ncbi:MAG: transcription elongation factor GreB [Candidatus Pacebacteria bacterium]|nr:transcription elongation factor GreB [Candidatus Paceibacterota bacterium]